MTIKQLLKIVCSVIMLALNVAWPLNSMESAPSGTATVGADELPANIRDALVGYRTPLPTIATPTGAGLAERICNLLCEYSCVDREKPDKVALEEQHKGALTAKIQELVATGVPLKLLLVGFPVKSCNSTKTSETLDLAEYVGLMTLEHICREIQTIYPPGASVTIYPHEPYLNEISTVVAATAKKPIYPPDRIETYQQRLMHLVHCFVNLRVAEIDSATQAAYDRMTRTPEAIKVAKTKSFWTGEISDVWDGVKVTCKVKTELAGHIARIYESGVESLRNALAENYPDYGSHVRLSIRAPEDGDIASKLGIQLVHDCHGTPWHGILGINRDGSITLDRKSDLLERGYQLTRCTIEGLALEYMIQP